jgi:hypothetical protein
VRELLTLSTIFLLARTQNRAAARLKSIALETLKDPAPAIINRTAGRNKLTSEFIFPLLKVTYYFTGSSAPVSHEKGTIKKGTSVLRLSSFFYIKFQI